MTSASRLRRLAGGCLALAACTDPPTEPEPPLERNTPLREWDFSTKSRDALNWVRVVRDSQTPGEVSATHLWGGKDLSLPFGNGTRTIGEVFSNPDGTTYWVASGQIGGGGTNATLEQRQSFKKNAADATLELEVTRIAVAGYDHNFDVYCTDEPFCPVAMAAGVQLTVVAYSARDNLFYRSSSAGLLWRRNGWELSVGDEAPPIWAESNFRQSLTPALATVDLAGAVKIPVDISRVGPGEEFTLWIVATAYTNNIVGRETALQAHLRDPLHVGGSTLQFRGLQPTNNPLPRPAAATLGAAPECTTPTAGAGTIQFAAPAFSLGESAFAGSGGLLVTRTGGTRGAVSATLRTSNGTAAAGTDYEAVTTTVAFADGDAGPRTVRVPILGNDRADPDRTVNLALSEPRGCATLGAAASVLTIHDDDTPATPSGHPVAGTVSGLTGSGLVLRNVTGGEELPVGANGAFIFTRRTPARLEYDVVVATQPAGPAQVCTVAGGRGTQGDAPVTNVAVTCTTPAPVGALDATFGVAGKVATPRAGGEAEAVVVQPDGKIVVAGKSTVTTTPGAGGSLDFTVLRYNADGTPDAGFGTGGVATAGFPAGRTDEALDVALQADGRIVVVGTTQASVAAGGDVEFGVARFTADGRLDASFGAGGLVSTDFGPGSATANGVAVQPDGRIVVAGNARLDFNTDFALARYNPDGTPDASFGSGGRVTTNIAGGTRADLGLAVALAPGGKIVVAGRAELGGSRGDDFGLARYNPNGTLDSGFGTGGVVTTDIGGGSQQANDVLVQADGRIVVAGYTGGSTGASDFALARYNGDGTPDASFGTAGTVAMDLSGQDDFGEGLAVQADGRLVVVGRRTSATFSDLAFARFNADGTLDASFGTAGTVAVDFFGAADLGQGVAVQPDGKIVGAGSALDGRATNVVLVRVRP